MEGQDGGELNGTPYIRPSVKSLGKRRAVSGDDEGESESYHTVHVFWPRELSQRGGSRASQLLLGWCVSGGPGEIVIVIAALVSRTQCEELGLASSHTLPKVASVTSTPCIVGVFRYDEDDLCQFAEEKEGGVVWVETTQRDSHTPSILSTKIPSPSSSTRIFCSVNLIAFSIPEPECMQFLALEPMVLPLAASFESLILRQDISYAPKKDARDLHERLKRLVQMDPKRSFEVSEQYPPGTGPGAGLRQAILLINRVRYLNDRVSRRLLHKASPQEHKVLRRIASMVISFVQSVKNVLTFRLKSNSTIRLSDISSTARQLDLRLGQAVLWPALGRQIRTQRLSEELPVSALSPAYIGLWNGVWLVANDIILGQAIGSWLCDNHLALGDLAGRNLEPLTIDKFQLVLRWLGDWPAGLKLNTELAQFFGDMYSGLTELWASHVVFYLVRNQGHAFSTFLFFIGLAGRIFGLTMLLSLVSDAFAILTAHLTLFYLISRSIYNFFLHSLSTLFYLFRGKKRNPLRQGRTDDATYDLDQLLLGTLFFTLLTFLWPTIAVYYFGFALARLSGVTFLILVETLLAIFNHLPLFAVMLRIKDGKRLPGGIRIEWKDSHLFTIDNVPLELGKIFRGYADHLQGLRIFPHLCLAVVTGNPIAPPSSLPYWNY